MYKRIQPCPRHSIGLLGKQKSFFCQLNPWNDNLQVHVMAFCKPLLKIIEIE